jgi:nucleoside-diphosphate-sugar epimerase
MIFLKSDIRKAKKEFNWEPHISKIMGIRRQYEWIVK